MADCAGASGEGRDNSLDGRQCRGSSRDHRRWTDRKSEANVRRSYRRRCGASGLGPASRAAAAAPLRNEPVRSCSYSLSMITTQLRPRSLAVVQRFVGELDETVVAAAGLRLDAGCADADRQPLAAAPARPACSMASASMPAWMRRAASSTWLRSRVVQHDREFLAAVARGDVQRPARAAAQAPGDLPQAFVAGLVTVVIVVGLEVIDIDQQQRRASTRSRVACGQMRSTCSSNSRRLWMPVRPSRLAVSISRRSSRIVGARWRAPACSTPSRRSRW